MRTRLPVKLKLAVVTAALTFGILCLFAVVIGAVAEERIRDGFDDDLRATVADIANRLDPELTPNGIDVDERELVLAASGDAELRVIQLNGDVYFPRDVTPLADPRSQGLSDASDFRVASRALTISNRSPAEDFNDPLPDERLFNPVGFVQYGKPKDTVATTVNRVRLFLAFGVLGGTALAFLGGLFVAQRAMRPIAGLTRAAREVARTRDPDITLAKPRANDEVSDLAHTFEDMLRELSAARGETEAALTRQREFVADASHELRTPLTSILANLELLESELEGERREIVHPILRHQDMAMYFRHREDHYAVGNYHHEPIQTAQSELRRPGDGPMPSLMPFTPADFDVAEAEAARLLPPLKGRMRPADPERSINGMFSFTPDAGSIVGESAKVRGVWICEAVWVTHGGGMGRQVAEWMALGEPSYEMAEADANRFYPYATTPPYVLERGTQQYREVYDIIHPRQQMARPRRLRLT
ncbi:MAG: histidine kinase dimerization/phospho-acceptor domain-containing protein, partial [Thermoleophilaceae bacterium]